MLLRAEGDLDGDGALEAITLTSDGVLHIGDLTYPLELHHPPDSYWWQRAAPDALRVVDLRRGDRRQEVLFWQSGPDDEDPPREYWVFAYDERGLDTTGRIDVGHGVTPTLDGRGRIRFRWESCWNDGRTASSIIEHERQRDGTLVPVRRQTTYRRSDCIFAACPFVYAGASDALVGEILRDLVGRSAAREQGLSLDPALVDDDGVLTITVREEKDEVSYLDRLFVVADGARVEADACAGGDVDATCALDDRPLVLGRGDAHTFVFHVGPRPIDLVLVADGFYVPLRPER
ncbi:MAG: hypothetical protein AB7S26_32105 [Sandaracinaceae bacterium]